MRVCRLHDAEQTCSSGNAMSVLKPTSFGRAFLQKTGFRGDAQRICCVFRTGRAQRRPLGASALALLPGEA
jgi:hypothetical protein